MTKKWIATNIGTRRLQEQPDEQPNEQPDNENPFASWTERFHEFVAKFLRTEYELPVKEVTDVSTRNEDWQLSTCTGGTEYYVDVSWTDTDGKNHFNSYSGTPSEFFRD